MGVLNQRFNANDQLFPLFLFFLFSFVSDDITRSHQLSKSRKNFHPGEKNPAGISQVENHAVGIPGHKFSIPDHCQILFHYSHSIVFCWKMVKIIPC